MTKTDSDWNASSPPNSIACCASMAPSGRAPARSIMKSGRANFIAPAAAPNCSNPAPNSKAVPAGPASMTPGPARWKPRPTPATAWCRTEVHCADAAAIWAMSSTDGPEPTGERYCIEWRGAGLQTGRPITTLVAPRHKERRPGKVDTGFPSGRAKSIKSRRWISSRKRNNASETSAER